MPKLVVKKHLRILDFDIENRPLSYLGSDFTTAEVTAIAASFVGSKDIHCWLLGEVTLSQMLLEFLELYKTADIVTGHYILAHDLPILNGALMEAGLGQLPATMVSDTKIHLKSRKGISASQESLADMLGVKSPKEQMTQNQWREANRLTPEGLEHTRRRVVGDIKQHKKLREILVERDLLGPAVGWRP